MARKRNGKKRHDGSDGARRTSSAAESYADYEARALAGVNVEEYTRQMSSILDNDGNLIYDGSDPTCRKYCSHYECAKRYHLQELERSIPEIFCALHTSEPKALSGAYMTLYGMGRPPSPPECRCAIQKHCEWLEKAFTAFSDKSVAKAWARDSAVSVWLITVLGPKSKFDLGHDMHQMSNAQMSIFQKGYNDEQRKQFREFEDEKPIDKCQRAEEEGYAKAARHAAHLTNAEIANEYGKKAWVKSKKWTAELYWKKATDLGSEAKYYSNLAVVRIHLGRYLRSIQVGYRELATKMLEQAVRDAKAATTIDPHFQRAYQRWAEALLALGPYDRAMEAYRILSKGMELVENISGTIIQLQETAKINARRWLPVASSASSIPATLHAALANLRSAVVGSLAVNQFTDEEMRKAADKITDAAWATRGAIGLLYMRRAQWEREKSIASGDRQISDETEIERQLRQISKLVPLRAVVLSTSLKRLVFSEEPWTLWGLDRLDRSNVPRLAYDATDPCAHDQDEGPMLEEKLKRLTGSGAMNLSSVMSVMERVKGKGPISYDQDMSPTHFAALGCGIMQRIILAKDCSLQKAASRRVIELYFSPNGNGLWAGGEFLGMCMNCASGVGKYDVPLDKARTAEFMRMPNGIAAMAKEINQSNDEHAYYQQALTTFLPKDWASLEPADIVPVLRDYILIGMDEDSFLKPEEIAPFVTTILSAMLDGVPDTLRFFRSGTFLNGQNVDGKSLTNFQAIIIAVQKSAFGIFLSRRFKHYEQSLMDSGHKHASTKDIIGLVIDKWSKLGKDKRSAYRWESLSDDTKKELSHMAPVDKVDLMKEGVHKDSKERPILKAPKCANCGETEGCGVVMLSCPCRSVKYCKSECQRADWPNHKTICKQIRSGKS